MNPTHYDILEVARDAPQEVIRGSYRTLSRKFHPDRNPGDAQAAEIMAGINASYDVLSDVYKRFAYDRWLAHQELLAQPWRTAGSRHATIGTRFVPVPRRASSVAASGRVRRGARYWLWCGFAALLVVSWVVVDATPRSAGRTPYRAAPLPAATDPVYARPAIAPNGSPWPLTAAYVDGYARLNTGGRSSVTVDNSRNATAAFVKLVSLDAPEARPVRTFFIPARRSFTVGEVAAGRYDIRYQDLGSGALSRSESFDLAETATQRGVEYHNVTMSLYRARHTSARTNSLSESEF